MNTFFSLAVGSVFTAVSLAFFAAFIGFFLGRIIAKYKEYQDYLQLKKTNPYRFFKELPNHYGIGVTSILFNSTIENEKDIVATILDLCAQKYLHLERYENKYMITIRKTDLSQLHRNEQYIMQLLIEGNINKINYQKWFQYCLEDGIKLNLFTPRDTKTTNQDSVTEIIDIVSDVQSSIVKEHRKLSKKQIRIIVFAIIAVIICGFIAGILTKEEYLFIIPFVSLLMGAMLCYAFYIFKAAFRMIHIGTKQSYSNAIHRQIQRTKHGDMELQKLYAFRAFLQHFGSFVNRKPEEVTLWEHYLSYAQVFGITKNIMASGYDQLVNNTAFKITSIDAINLRSITVQPSSSIT